jgi:23S rRNA pseudouridine1911/1915/1917 synthase
MNHDYTPNLFSDKVLTREVPQELDGARLDKALAELFPYSRSRLAQWIKEERVFVNGKTLAGKKTIQVGMLLSLHLPSLSPKVSDEAENMPLTVIFEDDELLIIDKPANLVVHPANGHASGTLYNAILYHHKSAHSLPRAGIVHRLDKDTTGLMVIAKSLISHAYLVEQLKARKITRIYWALVWGHPPQEGVIDAPIGRHPKERTKMAIVESGKPARTHFKTLQYYKDCALVRCQLETGRTHQIRVHLANLGYGVVGDALYGRPRSSQPLLRSFPRQALHAKELTLTHPKDGHVYQWTSSLPEDLLTLLDSLQ